jgi:hypothetical protein
MGRGEDIVVWRDVIYSAELDRNTRVVEGYRYVHYIEVLVKALCVE